MIRNYGLTNVGDASGSSVNLILELLESMNWSEKQEEAENEMSEKCEVLEAGEEKEVGEL